MKIYCSGIGGIGLSAYAFLQQENGHTVRGSDRVESAMTAALAGKGIAVSYQQDGSHVPQDCDLFVYSEAIPQDAPERRKAAELGIRQCSYFQALGELSRNCRVIAVCGTHGKSSTTAMAAKVLMDAGQDPTVVVGTTSPDLGGRNWRKGASDLFLLEACEYRRSFHHLSPDIILMTNADGDHFDAFASVAEYQQAFVDFFRLLPEGGAVITHMGDPDCARIVESGGVPAIDADACALPRLSVPGEHMQRNAQLALALADLLHIPGAQAAASLASYRGCWRRLERKGEYRGVPVFDDYGHHPREIQATLAALRHEYPEERIICVFQPHMHNRTLKLYDQFVRAFGDADTVIIPNVYDARSDVETRRVDVDDFVEDIRRHGARTARNGHSLRETEWLLKEEILREGDVLLCMGAGDITQLASCMVS